MKARYARAGVDIEIGDTNDVRSGTVGETIVGAHRDPGRRLKFAPSSETTNGCIGCEPASPLVMKEKSRPGDEKRSNMPKSAEAVTPPRRELRL